MKPLIISGLVGIVLGLGGCATSEAYRVKIERDFVELSGVPLVEIDSLCINNSQAYRTYTFKSRSEGIEEIRKFVRESDIEEAWVFTPRYGGIWFEVGSIGWDHDLKLDEGYVLRLGDYFKDIEVSHFHRHIEDNAQDILMEGVPSQWDIEGSVGVTLGLYVINPGAKLSEFVVSDFGVAEYGLSNNERGESRISEIYQKTLEERNSRMDGDIVDDIRIEYENERLRVLTLPMRHRAHPVTRDEIKRRLEYGHIETKDIIVEFFPFLD